MMANGEVLIAHGAVIAGAVHADDGRLATVLD
jgi:hypothetical protein